MSDEPEDLHTKREPDGSYTVTINGTAYQPEPDETDGRSHHRTQTTPTNTSENPADQHSPLTATPGDGSGAHQAENAQTPPTDNPLDEFLDNPEQVASLLSSEDERGGRAARAVGRVTDVGWWRHAVWRAWQALGEGAWAAAGLVVRWPVWAAVTAAVGLWAAPERLRQAVTVCAIVAVAAGLGGRATLRVRSVSVVRQFNFRKRKATVRKEWSTAMANASMVKANSDDKQAGKRMPVIKAISEHPHGVSVLVNPRPVGADRNDFIAEGRHLVNTFGALSMRAVDVTTWRGRAIRLDFRWTEPFPRTVRIADLPRRARRHMHVVVGLDEDGRGFEVNPFKPRLLVGEPGAGKSTALWTLLYQLMKAGFKVRLRIFDPKGGIELGALEHGCWAYESSPARWAHFLGQACAALQARQAQLRREGDGRLRAVPVGTVEYPLDLLVVDEFVTMIAMSKGSMRAFGQTISVKDALAVLLSQMRAAGGSAVAATQLVEKVVMGPARALFPFVECMRVGPTEKSSVNIVLGDGASALYPAHLLAPDETTAGISYARTPTEGVVKYRGAELTEEERREVEEWLIRTLQEDRARHGKDPEVGAVNFVPATNPAKKAAAKKAAPRKAAPRKAAPKKAAAAAPVEGGTE